MDHGEVFFSSFGSHYLAKMRKWRRRKLKGGGCRRKDVGGKIAEDEEGRKMKTRTEGRRKRKSGRTRKC